MTERTKSSQSRALSARVRRDRSDIRELLIQSAVVEFAASGFNGASTRSIAERADAHQPQINYHFASKLELWRATVDHLFGLLDEKLTGIDDIEDPAESFAENIRRLVHFAAEHPHLNRIIVQEASSLNPRMLWLTNVHIRPRFNLRRQLWRNLQEAGIAAPIPDELVHHVLIGAASQPYVSSYETKLLLERQELDSRLVDAHAEGLVTTLLPGYRPPQRSGD
jgi:TetR/AcrR family transcriptional regulator